MQEAKFQRVCWLHRSYVTYEALQSMRQMDRAQRVYFYFTCCHEWTLRKIHDNFWKEIAPYWQNYVSQEQIIKHYFERSIRQTEMLEAMTDDSIEQLLLIDKIRPQILEYLCLPSA